MRRRSRAGFVWLWVVAWILGGLAAAQAQQSSTASDPAVAVSRGRRALDVSLLDKRGEPVAGARAQQLVVFDDDQRVDNPALTQAGTQPESVCILIDDSGSMYANAVAVKEEVQRLLAELPANDEVCLMAFASQVAPAADFQQSRAAVADSLRRLPIPHGPSASIDAMVWAARHLMEKAKFPSRSIILIGDGDDNASKLDDSALRDLLRRSGAPVVYAIANPDEDGMSGDRLKWMTEETGGVACFLKKRSKGEATAERLVRVIDSRYRLEISGNDASLNSEIHRLRVVPDGDLRKQHVQVKVAREYDASR